MLGVFFQVCRNLYTIFRDRPFFPLQAPRERRSLALTTLDIFCGPPRPLLTPWLLLQDFSFICFMVHHHPSVCALLGATTFKKGRTRLISSFHVCICSCPSEGFFHFFFLSCITGPHLYLSFSAPLHGPSNAPLWLHMLLPPHPPQG